MKRTPAERFKALFVEGPPGHCWQWTGAQTSRAYGCFGLGGKGKTVLAHRFAYQQLFGPIPEGLQIDHLCSNKLCVNPSHLEAVTGAENNRRAADRITHCVKGHPLFGSNLIPRKDGKRACRECKRESDRKSDRLRRAAERALRPELLTIADEDHPSQRTIQ